MHGIGRRVIAAVLPVVLASPVIVGIGASARASTLTVTGPYPVGGTYVETPVNVGPFADANGNLYYLSELAEATPTVTMRKSTDGGRTWTVVDAAGRPASADWEAADVVQDGPTLHVFLNEGESKVAARYFTFRTSDHPTAPDTWGIKDEPVTVPIALSASQQAAALVRRNDGTLVAFYNRSVSGYDKLFFKVRTSDGGWGGERILEDEAAVHWHAVVAVSDKNDTTHVMYYGSNGRIWYRTLSSAGVLSERMLMESNVGTSARNRHPFVPPVRWMSGGVEKIMFLYNHAVGSSGTWRLRSRLITNGGPPTDQMIVTPNVQVAQDPGSGFGSRQPVASAAVDGDKVMVVFAARAGTSTSETNHLWYTESVDGGGWSAEEILLDRANFLYQPPTLPDQVYEVRAEVVEHAGVRALGLIADQEPTGGTNGSFYAELPLVGSGEPPPPDDNHPPVVLSLAVPQNAPGTNDTLSVNVDADDPDGDPLTYSYQWLKNGTALGGQIGATLNLATPGNGDRGDAISVRVVASDGRASSAPVTSPSVMIVNSDPTFDRDLGDRSTVEGDSVSFSAAATDADGDPSIYSATGLPAGVSIGTSTGIVSGTVAAGAASASPYPVAITVRDGAEIDATDTFTWTVTPGTTTPPPPPEGISFRAASSATSTGTTLTVARPTGATTGDILVASVDVSGNRTVGAPSGWTLLGTDLAGSTFSKSTYWHLVGANDPASYVWSFGTSGAASGIVLAYRGVDPANPIGATAGQVNTSSKSIAAPSVTTTAPNSMVVGFFSIATTGGITEPAGMVERAETGTSGTTKLRSDAADQVLGAAGATGPRTATASKAAVNVGRLVALRPAT